ncbi:hypothetical protein DQ240_22535 [Blastococcus sp. TF02A-26]|nr:hypothetical protein DQ240_22535 [Blastococcus sp. TF02A-26]
MTTSSITDGTERLEAVPGLRDDDQGALSPLSGGQWRDESFSAAEPEDHRFSEFLCPARGTLADNPTMVCLSVLS